MSVHPTAKFAALLAISVVLAACESETAPPPAQDDGRGAKGEVLGGTISDDMLPLDTLRSQSPPQRAASGGTAQAEAGDDDGAVEIETGAPSEPAEVTEAEIEDAE